MKTKISFTFALVVGLGLAISQAQAAPRSKKTAVAPATTAEKPVSTSQAAPARAGMPAFDRFGVGFATLRSLTGGSGGAPVLIDFQGVSTWVEFSSIHSAQLALSIPSTGPFAMAGTLAYRLNLHGTNSNGFHAGLGTTMGGYGGAFYINIHPMLGFQFTPANLNNILLSFDGGPNFQIADGNFNFNFNALSAQLGFAIHYLF